MRKKKRGFWQRHSLSLVIGGFLILWIVLYVYSNPGKHMGAFFGNAIADWTGILITVVITKFLYEKDSKESNVPRGRKPRNCIQCFFKEHSLSIFLIITGIGWLILYGLMDCQSKWGQVVGNILSEWTQIFCLVILTKKLVEIHSPESK